MSVSGLCQICETAEAVDNCTHCGALACDRHLDDETWLCTSCASELNRGAGGGDTGSERGGKNEDVQGEYEY